MRLKYVALIMAVSNPIFAELPLGTFCKHGSPVHEYIHFNEDGTANIGSDVMGMPNPHTYLKVEEVPSQQRGTGLTITERYKDTDEALGSPVYFSFWNDSEILFRGHWRVKDDFSPRFCEN